MIHFMPALDTNDAKGLASPGRVNRQSPIQPVSERYPALEEHEVVLTFLAPEAGEVTVAGNFNDWCPKATSLENTGAGKWIARLMFRSGQYEYRFVVDGRWREDPLASQRVANPHGSFNSVLLVPLSDRTSLL
jgi:1,4-alpha-glucan branching enzyme